jgi:hypothetical protein
MSQMKRLASVLFLIVAAASSQDASAAEVLLSCWGTVELMQQGKQANPQGERLSMTVAVDVARKAMTIDGVNWPISGNTSGETVVAMSPDKGSVTLNRITGSVSAHLIELTGLKKFYGECKPAQRLF